MAGQPDRHPGSLSVPRPPRELQVALEHLGNTVHPAVPEGTPTGQHREGTGTVAVDPVIASTS